MQTLTGTDKIVLPSIADVPRNSWEQLSRLRVFFGHQSVGYNIIDGIADVMNERREIGLNVIETCDPQQFSKPVFAHARVGRNTDPLSKIQGFRDILSSGVGDNCDIAFLKFCYVDITRNSDPQEIFDVYSRTVEELRGRYGRTSFLHVTVPLRSRPKGMMPNLKQSIKSFVRRPGALEDNAARDRYNRLLADACAEGEPFFDLALAESTTPEGSMCHVGRGAAKVGFMVSQYTDDGGHLNSLGRKRAAEQLLITLARMVHRPG